MENVKLEYCELNYLKGNDNGTTRDFVSITLKNGRKLVLHIDTNKILYQSDINMHTI